MDIYIDILVLENIVINYLILLATSKFIRIKMNGLRALLAAAVGTAYVVIMLIIPSASFYFTISGKIILSILMNVITFKFSKFKEFLKILISFYISTFIFAGAAFAYIYISGSGGFVQNGVYYIFKKSDTNMVIFAILMAVILIDIFYKWIFSKSKHKDNLVDFAITMGERSLILKGLVDTGNLLHDPISNLPVVICELEAVKELVPEQLAAIVKENKLPDLNNVSIMLPENSWISKIRLIPYSSLGKENGMLLGFKPDKFCIGNSGENKHEECAAIVCLYGKNLSSNNTYNALLSPDLITIT